MGVWLKMDLWSDKLHCFLKPSLSYPTKPVDSEVLCPHSDASGGDWNAIGIQTWGSNHFETYPFWNLPGTTKVEQLLKLGHPETCVIHGHSCMTKHSARSPKMDASTPTTVISSVVFRTSKWVCQYILSTKIFMLLVSVASSNFHDSTGEQQLPWPLSVATGCTRPVSSCWWHGTFESFPQKPSPPPWRSLGTYPVTLSCGMVEPPKISNCHWGSFGDHQRSQWKMVESQKSVKPRTRKIPQTKAIGWLYRTLLFGDFQQT